MTATAETAHGVVDIEQGVALADLRPGDLVLGLDDGAPVRTLYRVTEPLGQHKVPFEEPVGWLTRTFASGAPVDGILVASYGPEPAPALFALDTTPELDRVIGGPQ